MQLDSYSIDATNTPYHMTPNNRKSADKMSNEFSANKGTTEICNVKNQKGLIMRALEDIFIQTETIQENKYIISCSFFEIYNDVVYDLLKPVELLHES